MVVIEPSRHAVEETDYCYACQGTKLITDSYSCELVCANCGLVISDKVEDIQTYEDTGWNLISPISNQLSSYDMGLYTNIWDVTKDVNLSTAVVEKTAYIYRKAKDRNLIRGRSKPSMLAACLYIACRELQNNRSLEDILHATDLKKKDLFRCYRLLLFELELRSPAIDPIRCVAKIANLTCVSEVSRRDAFEAINRMVKLGMTAGKNPMGLVASLVYMSCSKAGESITQADIAQVAGITEMTLRNRIRDIRRISHDIYPS